MTLPFQRLAAWREANDLSLAEAGKKVGVHGPTWHEWETGGRVPLGGYRDALEILTGIPAAEWMPERERRAIETAKESVASAADLDVAPSPTLPASTEAA